MTTETPTPSLTLTHAETVALPPRCAATFTGYSRGERWNGFGCPRFPRAVADRVARAVRAEPGPETLVYDEAHDRYVYRTPDAEESYSFVGVDAVMPDGQVRRVYPIGAWCWSWQVVEG